MSVQSGSEPEQQAPCYKLFLLQTPQTLGDMITPAVLISMRKGWMFDVRVCFFFCHNKKKKVQAGSLYESTHDYGVMGTYVTVRALLRGVCRTN